MSATPSASHELVYFGKLPSRGDFVRSAHHSALIEHLDRWQSQTMERLATDPRWKLRYDAAPTLCSCDPGHRPAGWAWPVTGVPARTHPAAAFLS